MAKKKTTPAEPRGPEGGSGENERLLHAESVQQAQRRGMIHQACVECPAMREVERIDRLGTELSRRIGEFRKRHHRHCGCDFCVYVQKFSPRIRDDLMVCESNLDMNLSLILSELPIIRT